MYQLGKSVSTEGHAARPVRERVASAGYAAMAYWYYRWDWGEAVALDGLLAAGRRYALPACVQWVTDEVGAWVDREQPGQRPHVLGPAVALLDVIESGMLGADEASRGWDLAARLTVEVVSSSRSTGALTPEGDRNMVFVDSLYGLPEFMVRFADSTGDTDLVSTVVALVVGHCRALQRDDGLFAHCADLGDPSVPAIAWGRGNGWAVLGLTRFLDVLGRERVERELVERYGRLTHALLTHQEAGGRWRNLVDDPHSYPEASTTAMASAAFTQAARGGLLSAEFGAAADAAWESVADRIDTSGFLVGVSYRPGVNTDPRRYEHTPVVGSYPWGQGPYLLAAAQRAPDPSADATHGGGRP